MLISPKTSDLLKAEWSGTAHDRSRKEVFEDIFTGGMPDICTGNAACELYFRSYGSTHIEKDVRKLISASSELQFRNFISIAALRTAQELHYDEIADSVGIDVRTCKKWLSILETSGIIFLLQLLHYEMYSPSIQTVAEKEYVMDRLLTKEPTYKKGDADITAKIAEKYPAAVKHARKTVSNLLQDGLPGLDDSDKRNRRLCQKCLTFSTVYEAIDFLSSSG